MQRIKKRIHLTEMASFSMTSLLFLLIVAPSVCSAFLRIGNVGKQLKINPTKQINPKQSMNYFQKLLQATRARKKGKELANKYFGPGGFENGFRWGRKLNKTYKWYERYCAVADTCQYFEQTLTSCTPSQNNYAPGCVLHCIVKITESIADNTPDSCSYYADCDYPEEATCNADQPGTINATCTD